MVILLSLWLVMSLILMGYYILIFRLPIEKPVPVSDKKPPGVSVVIALKNGHPEFASYLEEIVKQEYPLFEIIIVDDHSEPGALQELMQIVHQYANIRLIHSSRTPGKKNALSTGIEEASFPLILCTDADCFPQSRQWISSMVSQATSHQMVLGYSPYEKQKGILNLWIRFETQVTGMQYLSWAGRGRAYMGVGRNLLFPKEWFLQSQPFEKFKDVPYGDDDMLVQQAIKELTVVPWLSDDAFVISQPESSWSSWWRQKHRHMSAGHQYSFGSWLQPGAFSIALMVHWALLPAIVIAYPLTMWLFFAGMILRWIRHRQWSGRLRDRDTLPGYPLLEATYALYLAGMGAFTLFNRRKSWN